MRLIFSAEAETDLEAIGDWIARDNPNRARTFVQELRSSCAALATMPHAHPLVTRHERTGVRRRPHGRYLIFYQATDDAVHIVRVLHGARDYEPIVFPEQ
jgi:toxin ParE1/3/4